jgi:hypothetical protein
VTERGPADSAGLPWAGRTLPAGPFAGDDGAPDAALMAALGLDAELGVGPLVDAELVVAALAQARVFVPLITLPGADDGDSAEMALVTLTGPDGRMALPIFSQPQALAKWNNQARPVPVSGPRAAMSAVAQGCDLLVLDPAGPVTFVVARPAVWALGQGQTWHLPGRDDEIAAALAAVSAEVSLPGALTADPDSGSELIINARLPPGIPQDQISTLAARLQAAIETNPTLRQRVDAIKLRVRACSDE